jgi:hypothetical protein
VQLEHYLGPLLRSERAASSSPLITALERGTIRSVATALATLRAAPAEPAQLASAVPSIQAYRPNSSVPLATGLLLGLLGGVGLAAALAQKRRRRDPSHANLRLRSAPVE